MKIAILYSGHPSFTKGLASYVNEKCRRMQEMQDDNLQVDCYMLRDDYTPLMKFLLKLQSRNVEDRGVHVSECTVKGVSYKCLWRNYGVMDNLLYSKLGIKWWEERFMKRVAKRLKDYDVICTHKTVCHQVGVYMKRHYGIPFIATWHGSDINVYPYEKKIIKQDTVEALEAADMNLFVSKGLMQASNKFTRKAKCDVIYTGAAKHFQRFSDEKRKKLKQMNYVDGCKVVGFVGNLVSVKNVMALPDIFKKISELYKKRKLVYWIIGNGEFEQDLRASFVNTDIDVRFLGRKDSMELPAFYNCMDVLVLPSKEEGFGLVAVEARTCGANVVGSNIGGIPEAIEQAENCFSLDAVFTDNISKRIVEILEKEEQPVQLSKELNWDFAIEKELSLCKRITERN